MANKFWSTMLAGALGGAATFGAAKFFDKNPNANTDNAAITAAARQVSYQGAPAPFDFTKAAENSMSGVVHIKATESQQSAIQRQRSNPWSFFSATTSPSPARVPARASFIPTTATS